MKKQHSENVSENIKYKTIAASSNRTSCDSSTGRVSSCFCNNYTFTLSNNHIFIYSNNLIIYSFFIKDNFGNEHQLEYPTSSRFLHRPCLLQQVWI